MISLTFKIDDRFLASYIIANHGGDRYVDYISPKYKKDLVAFQNVAWELSPDYSTLIDGRNYIYLYSQYAEKNYKDIGQELESYIQKLTKTEEYRKLKNQTEDGLKKLDKEWQDNYVKTAAYIENIGIAIKGNYTVWVTHPMLKSGRYTGKNNIIWSYQTYWKNYNTVYLWHEILHSYFGKSETEHALIELITDEEMRVQLNGGTYPPFCGHKALDRLKSSILPAWNDYKQKEKKNLQELISKIQ